MVCAICLDDLFSALAMNSPTTSSALGEDNRIAALSCGHTFHLECTTLWRANCSNMNCPMCNVLHIGPFLTLHIECDLKHVTDQAEDTLGLEGLSISDPLRVAESLCNSSLDQADQQANKHRELEAKAAAIKIKLDEKSKCLRRKQAIESALTKKAIRVENRVKELSTLSERHKANINGLQNALTHSKQIIAELEKQIREQDGEP